MLLHAGLHGDTLWQYKEVSIKVVKGLMNQQTEPLKEGKIRNLNPRACYS